MLSWLKDILGDAYTEDIDKKVSQEIGKNFVAKVDFNAKNEALKTAEAQMRERDAQLETLQKSNGDAAALKEQIAKLQTENADAAKAYEEKVKSLKIDAAVDMALMAAKAKNVKAVKALLDLDNAELDADGTVKGLKAQIKKLSEAADSGFMFEVAAKKAFEGLKPGESKDGVPQAMTLDALRKLSPAERFNYAQTHPDEYKQLYGG